MKAAMDKGVGQRQPIFQYGIGDSFGCRWFVFLDQEDLVGCSAGFRTILRCHCQRKSMIWTWWNLARMKTIGC
eukprot:jgi/Botrbrau1/6436/Bobra.0034s0012.1